MSRNINIARAGSICNGIEHIREVYTNHAKLIQELLVKTKMIDTLSTDVDKLKGKESATPEELKTLQSELETLKSTIKEIDSLKDEINAIKSDDQTEIKKELLDALNKSIPKFTTEQEEKSDDCVTRSPIRCDFPFEIPKSEDGTDGWAINGIEVVPTSKDEQRLCSISTDYGGIAIDKSGSDDRWVIERNDGDKLKIHFNSDETVPLTITRNGASTPHLTVGDKSITSIATVINEDTISSKSVPTTKAIVDFVNANVIKSNVESIVNGEKSRSAPHTPVAAHAPQLPSCDISTIETSEGKSLLIDNSSSSISVKKDGSIITVKPSLTNGLMINDAYKLANDPGMLCILKDDSIGDIEGRYVEYTGNVIEVNGILIMEVQILKETISSVTCGIVGKDLKNQKTYTHGNKIYKLPKVGEDGHKYHYITIFNSGIHYVKVKPGKFAKGMMLVPGKEGLADRGSDSLSKFCMDNMIPRAKVVSLINEKVVAMLV